MDAIKGSENQSNLLLSNSTRLKYDLMMCIYEALQEEFENNCYSGNLARTIKLSTESSNLTPIGEENGETIYAKGENNFSIEIQAIRYDLRIFRETGQVVYTQTNSIRKQDKMIKNIREGKSPTAGMKINTGGNNLGGSYADEVDRTGGFSGDHKNYVERCIKKGIEKWVKMHPDLDISSNL